MIWQEVKITLSDAGSVGAEMLTAELLRLGVAGWQVESAQDLRRYLQSADSPFDYAADELRRKAAQADADTTIFTVYLADDEQGAQIIAALRRLAAQNDKMQVWLKRRDSEEWEDNWKQYYKPFKIGSRLVVCPSWEDYEPAQDELLLRIEPGGSFGTGQHQTTQLCLELLEEVLLRQQPNPGRLLDLGCGTGILSIGGLLLGCQSAAAVDIEEHSARAAAANAVLNGIGPDRYQTFWGDILRQPDILKALRACAEPSGYDIITVNIVADVIIAMSPLLPGLLNEQGRVICSGIIDNRRDEVLAAMQAQGFALQAERQAAGWCAMLFFQTAAKGGQTNGSCFV